ncbi:hypothetical protein WSM22_02640 [Cytophagales bacterium WSM2-2]|nr:hypothetical protein WSM22_02640 [Cytophagales bacterium WSM2-2]
MITEELKKVLVRDIDRLKEEISLYRDEQSIWKIEKEIANSGGNLCLHLIGNLKHYIGVTMGDLKFTRNREEEFTLKNIPKAELIKMVEETREAVSRALDNTKDEELDKEYPLLVFKEKTSTVFFMIHLAAHLGYHLGQVNYHRRLVAANT